MKRRAVLATVSTSLAVTLAGCGCRSYTELSYDITLDEISYNSTTGEWDGQCSLWVNFDDVSEHSTLGISDAGIALYGSEGHRVGLVEFGNALWDDVSEPNRSEGECDNYRGTLSRRGEFAVSVFPTYFALWYSDLPPLESRREHVVREALKYTGTGTEIESVDPSQWSIVEETGTSFPPIPTQSPELGEYVVDAELDNYFRECYGDAGTPSVDWGDRDWDFTIDGAIQRADNQFLPELERAAIREDADILDVTVQMRPFRRPPAPTCDLARTEYSVGIDLLNSPPQEIDVTHRDSDGNKLVSYRIGT